MSWSLVNGSKQVFTKLKFIRFLFHMSFHLNCEVVIYIVSPQTKDRILLWIDDTSTRNRQRRVVIFLTNWTNMLKLFVMLTSNVSISVLFSFITLTTSITFMNFNFWMYYKMSSVMSFHLSWTITFSTSRFLLHWSINMLTLHMLHSHMLHSQVPSSAMSWSHGEHGK